MPIEPTEPSAEPTATPRRRLSRPVMATGVACACLLGAALGLWAKPSDVDQEPGGRPAAESASLTAAAPPRRLEIRIDAKAAEAAKAAAAAPAHPQPNAPISAQPVTAAPLEPVAPPPEPMAPKPAPEGLMRVHAVAPLQLEENRPPAMRAIPAPAEPALAARKAAEARAQAQRAALAKREAARAAEARRKAEKVEAQRRASLEKAHGEARRKAAARALAKAEAQAKALKRKAAAQEAQARQERIAEAKARAAAERNAEARRAELKKAEALAKAEQARAARARAERAKAAASVRVARNRCASPDPGAVLACADPSLGPAERQLSRAYREAEAAGVPASTLERQQQRWLAARAAAARQAPWAVHDVYLARIAELKDQTRQAASGD
jgi:hypothetical protein